eukprot:SAG31_NODE_531_length_14413_cov_7.712659_21_plen_57_part_00
MFLIGLRPAKIPINYYFVRLYSYVCTYTSVYLYTLCVSVHTSSTGYREMWGTRRRR